MLTYTDNYWRMIASNKFVCKHQHRSLHYIHLRIIVADLKGAPVPCDMRSPGSKSKRKRALNLCLPRCPEWLALWTSLCPGQILRKPHCRLPYASAPWLPKEIALQTSNSGHPWARVTETNLINLAIQRRNLQWHHRSPRSKLVARGCLLLLCWAREVVQRPQCTTRLRNISCLHLITPPSPLQQALRHSWHPSKATITSRSKYSQRTACEWNQSMICFETHSCVPTGPGFCVSLQFMQHD